MTLLQDNHMNFFPNYFHSVYWWNVVFICFWQKFPVKVSFFSLVVQNARTQSITLIIFSFEIIYHQRYREALTNWSIASIFGAHWRRLCCSLPPIPGILVWPMRPRILSWHTYIHITIYLVFKEKPLFTVGRQELFKVTAPAQNCFICRWQSFFLIGTIKKQKKPWRSESQWGYFGKESGDKSMAWLETLT